MPGVFTNCIDAATRHCAVLGHPVRHSASPAMQNAALAALGLNWRYLAFDVPPNDLAAAIEGARRMGFAGLNLTVPHKVAGMELVDDVENRARDWGAINTIRFEGRTGGGEWQPAGLFDAPPRELRAVGFNTDGDAFVRSIREDLGLDLAGKRVLLLGAGGAARVAALRLGEESLGELFLVNRTISRAEDLAMELRSRFPSMLVHASYPTDSIDLVVNGTSLGLKVDDGLPFEAERFPVGRAAFAFDMVYGTRPTLFLAAAAEAGCKVADGLSMLLYQGAAALELWTGKPAPVDVMRAALWAKVRPAAGGQTSAYG